MWLTNVRLVGVPTRQALFFNVDQVLTHIQDQVQWEQAPESLAPIELDPESSAPQNIATQGSESFDFAGDWLSLGGVDLQINGALGLAFPDLTPGDGDRLHTIGQYLWQQGINAYLPTLVTTTVDNIHRALGVIAEFREAAYQHRPIAGQTTPSLQGAKMQGAKMQEAKMQEAKMQEAKILGAHLEGPCLNAKKRGAHPEKHLLPLSPNTLQEILGNYPDQVTVLTLAPELDPSGKSLAELKHHGIVISLGHSMATFAEAERAFEQGATMVTHAFNAMPPLHHRQPGLLASALLNPSVSCGMIADGQHVAPAMLTLLLRANPCGLFLVSDALAPLGLPDGKYPWDEREIEVKQGTARLPDGTLSGTTYPLLKGVQNLVQWGCCDPDTAIALATEAPRRAIGLKGLGLGCSAQDCLRWTLTDGDQLTWRRLDLPSMVAKVEGRNAR